MSNKGAPEKKSSRLRRRVSISFTKPSLTKQSFKDDADVNNIMRKYNKTGQLPDLIRQNPQYGEFADMLDYQESLNLVIHAQEQFAALPAAVRKRFHNDPAEFLEFAQDSKNAKEMVSLGLATERPVKGQPEASKQDPKPSEGDPPKKDPDPSKG